MWNFFFPFFFFLYQTKFLSDVFPSFCKNRNTFRWISTGQRRMGYVRATRGLSSTFFPPQLFWGSYQSFGKSWCSDFFRSSIMWVGKRGRYFTLDSGKWIIFRYRLNACSYLPRSIVIKKNRERSLLISFSILTFTAVHGWSEIRVTLYRAGYCHDNRKLRLCYCSVIIWFIYIRICGGAHGILISGA